MPVHGGGGIRRLTAAVTGGKNRAEADGGSAPAIPELDRRHCREV